MIGVFFALLFFYPIELELTAVATLVLILFTWYHFRFIYSNED